MFIKRKTADRDGWRRVTRRSYAQEFVETETFTGYVTLLHIEQVTEPLRIRMVGREYSIADNGFLWLHHVPLEGAHVVTAMYNAAHQVLQWYIDIRKDMGLNDNGVPWFDDLFLDIVVFPDGEVVVKDEDELDAALAKGVITQAEHDFAWQEARRLLDLINRGAFAPLQLADIHRDLLLAKLNSV